MTRFINRLIRFFKKPACFFVAASLAIALAQTMAQYSVVVTSRILTETAHTAAPVGGVDLFNYTFANGLMQAFVTASILMVWPFYKWLVKIVDWSIVLVKHYYERKARKVEEAPVEESPVEEESTEEEKPTAKKTTARKSTRKKRRK
jgi:hypothetical protein